MTERGWRRAFDDPIPLPGGGELRTLRDAANYITKLPKAEHDAPEWQAAIEALMLVADRGGPTMFARIRRDEGANPIVPLGDSPRQCTGFPNRAERNLPKANRMCKTRLK